MLSRDGCFDDDDDDDGDDDDGDDDVGDDGDDDVGDDDGDDDDGDDDEVRMNVRHVKKQQHSQTVPTKYPWILTRRNAVPSPEAGHSPGNTRGAAAVSCWLQVS